MDSVRLRNDNGTLLGWKDLLPDLILPAVGRALASCLHPAVCRSIIHSVSASTQSTGQSAVLSDSVNESLLPVDVEAVA